MTETPNPLNSVDNLSLLRSHMSQSDFGNWSKIQEKLPEKFRKMSRREFLGLMSTGGLALLLSACGAENPQDTSNTAQTENSTVMDAENLFAQRINLENRQIHIGREFDVAQEMNITGLPGWQPDAGIWAIKNPNFQLIVPARRETYLISGVPPKSKEVLAPDHREDPSRGFLEYRGMGGGVQLPDGRVIGFSHDEYWPEIGNLKPGQHFRAAISMHISDDYGNTFREVNTIIDGQNAKPASELRINVAGAGQPSAFLYGDKLRVCYIDWSMGLEQDSLALAECPLDQIENPDAWKKWDGEGFNSPARGGRSKSILPPFDFNGEPTHYTALPSIVSYKDVHLMSFETDLGFFLAQSRDGGITWSEPQLTLKFPQRHGQRQRGQVWYSYPSIVMDRPDEGKGMLFYSKGKQWLVDPHQWMGRQIEIT